MSKKDGKKQSQKYISKSIPSEQAIALQRETKKRQVSNRKALAMAAKKLASDMTFVEQRIAEKVYYGGLVKKFVDEVQAKIKKELLGSKDKNILAGVINTSGEFKF